MEALRKEKERYTYSDYLKWDDGERWELIDGAAYAMSPAPSWRHQGISIELSRQLGNYLEGNPCRVYVAPFDVRLFPEPDMSDKTVLQPDILVVCDKEKLSDGKACRGAPDFIIEVMSGSSEGRDLIDKKKKYEAAGVKEYWAVGEEKLYRFVLIDGKYQEAVFETGKSIKLELFALKGCKINV